VAVGNPTIFRSQVASDEYLSERVKPEIRDVIFRLNTSATPLTALTRGLARESCNNYKFQWLKDELLPWRTESAETTDSGQLTIVLDSNKGFPVGAIALNVNSGEHMLVTARSGSTTIVVTRGVGETSAATITTDDGFYSLGRAYKEDETLGSIYMTQVTVDYNYTQIFRTPIGGSGRDEVTGLYGGRNRNHQRLQAGLAHRRDLENAFLFGERYASATSGATKLRTTTGGVLRFITANTTDASTTLTESDLDSFMQGVSTYDETMTERLLIASPILVTALGAFAKNKGRWNMTGSMTYYGVNMVDYHTPHGNLHVVKAAQTLLGSYNTSYLRYSGYGIALDMSDLKYRYMEGRDTKLLPNRQENDRDGWRDEYLTDSGLEVHWDEKHGYIYNFSTYSTS
jgi:hypothetical protein